MSGLINISSRLLLLVTLSNCGTLLQSNIFSIVYDASTRTLALNCSVGYFDKDITKVPSNKIGHVERFENINCDLVNLLPRIYSNWNITGTRIFNLKHFSKSNFILRREQFDTSIAVNTEELTLNNSNILRIKEFTFDIFRKLQVLSLAENKLTELPQHFSFPSLIELHLNNNNLKNLCEESFINFWQLEKINLGHNLITDLPQKLFHPLSNLKIVILSHNKFITIPNRFFENNTDLTEIYLDNGCLENIKKDAFVGLTKLKILDLAFNNLTTLPEDLLHDHISLTELGLKQNNIEWLPENFFENLQRLTTLDLDKNKLIALPKSLSKNLKELKTLRLSHNNLSKILDDTFDGLINLDMLYLDHNHIVSISNEAFRKLRSLRKLYIRYNHLTDSNETHSFIDGINMLEIIDLYGNSFTRIPNRISSKVLEFINLMYNQISFVDVADLLSTMYIALEENNIETVRMHLTEPKEEINSTIVYPGYSMRCDCRIYDIIRYIDYKYTHLISGGVSFGQMKCDSPEHLKTKWLNLMKPDDFKCDSSDLYTCPAECNCELFPKQKTFLIDCSNKSFEALPLLQYFVPRMYKNDLAGVTFEIIKMDIHLENNALTSFSSKNSNFTNVSGLFLSNNSISTIEWLPSSLDVLKVDNNKLTDLSSDIMSILRDSQSLKEVTLSNNLWECNCIWISFINEIMNKVQILDYDRILCSNGKYLKDLLKCEAHY